jgi:hypothetical protein
MLSYGIGTIPGLILIGLVVEEKYLRVANYAIDMIAHSRGCRHARELQRETVRIVESTGRGVALNMLYPYSEKRTGVQAAGGWPRPSLEQGGQFAEP